MPEVKKPIKIETIEIDTRAKAEKPSMQVVPTIREAPAVRLLQLYLEKIELMDPDERKELRELISSLCQPKYIFTQKAVPIEEEYLTNLNNKEKQDSDRAT